MNNGEPNIEQLIFLLNKIQITPWSSQNLDYALAKAGFFKDTNSTKIST